MQSNTETFKILSTENDTYFPVIDVRLAPDASLRATNYNYEMIGSKKLNAMGLFGNSIKIGIVDSGCIQGVYRYKNFTTERDTDLNGHGSHVTSILLDIAAAATYYMAKAMDVTGGGTKKQVIEAIRWLRAERVNLVNCSFGFNKGVDVLDLLDLIRECEAEGMIFVCAAGNDGGTPLFPSLESNVFCVGAVDKDMVVTDFSNKGLEVDLVAPGKDILGLSIKGFVLMSGTSQATPHVTGMLALFMEKSGLREFSQVYSFITKNSVMDLGIRGADGSYGYGLIQPTFGGVPVVEPKKKKVGWLKRLWRSIFEN